MTHYLHKINTGIIGNDADATSCTIGSVAIQSWFQAENMVWEQSRFPKYHMPKVVLASLTNESEPDQEVRCEGTNENVTSVLCNEEYKELKDNCTAWADKPLFEVEQGLGLRNGYLVPVEIEENGMKTKVIYNYSEAIART